MEDKPERRAGLQHSERLARRASARVADSAAEERAMDAAVKRSIKLHGA